MALNPQIINVLRQQFGGAGRPGSQTLATPRTSNETSLVGDRQLPVQGRTITPIQGLRGGYSVALDGQPIGNLYRGGPNGRFVGNGTPIPGVLKSPQSLQQGAMVRMPQQLGGGVGIQQPQRQYAPNAFQQQMMQAQAIRNRPIK